MADGVNKVFLLGNVGSDPELRVTTNGQSVLKVRMATTDSYLDKNRVRQEKTEWHSVVVWGKQAEALAKFVQKGSKVHVEGSLETRSWEKDGQKHYATEVKAMRLTVCGGAGAQNRHNSTEERQPGDDSYGQGSDDDVPY